MKSQENKRPRSCGSSFVGHSPAKYPLGIDTCIIFANPERATSLASGFVNAHLA
jgi:hypothetical protein